MARAIAAGWPDRRRLHYGVASLLCLLTLPLPGCDDAAPSSGSVLEAPTPGPEQPGTFLDSPSGEPPKPLIPSYVSIEILTAPDKGAVLAAATKAFGPSAEGVSGAGPQDPVVIVGALDPSRFTRDSVVALRASGARGNLLFWYPLAVARDRLTSGGTAGLWRGVLAVRDAVPGAGELGGTPRVHGFAVSAVDRPLVGDWPKPSLTGTHAGFRGPDGQAVVFLKSSVDVSSPAFEADLERLNSVRNQGGAVWVVLALPLSEPHVPTRFTP
ncbi:MAG: hypothetical protein IV100_22630 [Myxococcales bacterium]|nr:hypothetical protein [Myxococcales bacterium]